jgi:hypothetical protein
MLAKDSNKENTAMEGTKSVTFTMEDETQVTVKAGNLLILNAGEDKVAIGYKIGNGLVPLLFFANQLASPEELKARANAKAAAAAAIAAAEKAAADKAAAAKAAADAKADAGVPLSS